MAHKLRYIGDTKLCSFYSLKKNSLCFRTSKCSQSIHHVANNISHWFNRSWYSWSWRLDFNIFPWINKLLFLGNIELCIISLRFDIYMSEKFIRVPQNQIIYFSYFTYQSVIGELTTTLTYFYLLIDETFPQYLYNKKKHVITVMGIT